jgi:hypothetical protein
MSAEKIRELNDAFRTTMTGGRVMLTAGVDALPFGREGDGDPARGDVLGVHAGE